MMPRPSPSGFNFSPANPFSADPPREPDPGEHERDETRYDPGFDAVFAALQARFAARAAGLPPELSADLALDIVLNEIVEQACLATGASGAAIALERDRELVCRASSGTGAPPLGARLSRDSGLVAECIWSGRMLCCEDAENDPRADAAACRSLGVRSVMALPLWPEADAVDGTVVDKANAREEIIGVLAVFSPRAAAFGDRDQHTLEALSGSVLASLTRAATPPVERSIETTAEPDAAPHVALSDNLAIAPYATLNAEMEISLGDTAYRNADAHVESFESRAARSGGNRFSRIAIWILAPAVVAGAVLLVTITGKILLGENLLGKRSVAAQTPASSNSAASNNASSNGGGGANPLAGPHTGNDPGNAANAQETASATATSPTTSPANASSSNRVPPGGLAVYQNGKEVFRMPPGSPGAESLATDAAGSAASARDAAEVYELSPQAAAENLLHRVEPEYPSEARQQQIEGQVVLDAHIAPNGAVEDVLVVSGHPLLVRAAIDAVKQWRFRPHLVNGHAVAMQARLALNFKLSR